MFRSLFDESRFLSPYGLRSLSAVHRDQPYVLHLEGTTATIDYEPAESTTGMFGGNSNWRGPIWFPLNYLVISCLLKYHKFFGDDFTVEYPPGPASSGTLNEIATTCGTGSSRSSRGAATGGGPASAGWTGCSTTRNGATTSTSTSTSTATTRQGSAPATRPAGPGLIADVIRRRHGAVPETVDLIGDHVFPPGGTAPPVTPRMEGTARPSIPPRPPGPERPVRPPRCV